MTYHSFMGNNSLVLETVGGSTSAGTTWTELPANADAIAFILIAEAVGTTLDMKVQQATDSSGTSAKDVDDIDDTVLDIVQLDSDDDETITMVAFGPGALDVKNDFTYYRAYVTAAGTCAWHVIKVLYRLREPGNYTPDSSFLTDNSTELFAAGATVKTGLASNS